MNLTIGIVAFALGVAMVWVGSPKAGVSPAFMRNGIMELVYPICCLIVFIVGIGGIPSGLPWSIL